MRRSVAVIIILALAAGWSRAERYGGEFLNIPVGARAQGLGGAYGPAVDDASAFYWNPGALPRLPAYELMAGHTELFLGLASHDFLAAAGPLSSKIWIGLGWIRLGVDGIPRFSHTVGTPPQGEFSDNENAVYLAAATRHQHRALNRNLSLCLGGGLKAIYSRLDDHRATGLGLDAGLVVLLPLAPVPTAERNPGLGAGKFFVPGRPYLGELALSLVAGDVGGTVISWDTPRHHGDVRLSVVRGGLAYRQPLAFMRSSLLAGWEASTDDLQRNRFGAELELYRRLFLRAGIDNGRTAWGGGADLWRLRLDYAFVGHDLGNTHRVTIAIKL